MKERGRLVRVVRLDEFARTRRPRSISKLHELALCYMHSHDRAELEHTYGYFKHAVKAGKKAIVADSALHFIPLDIFIVEELAKKPGRLALDVKEGDVVFVKLRAEDKFFSIFGNLSLEPRESAAKAMESTRLVETKSP